MKTSSLYVTVFSLLIALNCSIAADFEKILQHEFASAGLEKAILESDSGKIRLEQSATGRVEVAVTMKTSTNTQEKANAIFDNCRVEFLDEGDGVVRAVIKSEKSGWDWLKFWKKFPSVDILYRVPEGIVLNIASGAGQISGENLSAEIKIATGAGDVDLNGLKGSLKIATGAGDVELRRFEGKLSAATGAGDFDANGTFSEFSVSSGAGDINLLVDNPVSGNSSISTGAGDIQISLPVGSSFDLGADVGFGEISCEFDIVDTDPDKKSFRGTYNEGSTRIRLSTGFGDIFVGRR